MRSAGTGGDRRRGIGRFPSDAHAPPRAARTLARTLCARPYGAVVVLLALLYLPWIAAIPLAGTIEGNRLQAAREMLGSGDWLVPTLGGTVYLAKPPLHPWTIAIASWPFGEVSIAGGRIVSTLFAIGLAGLVLAWGRRELGLRAGLFAAFALGLSVLFFEKAVRAELEIELAFFTTVALLLVWSASFEPRTARSALLRTASGLALGASVLVKGPPGLIVFVPATIAAAWGAGSRRRAWFISAGSALLGSFLCALAWIVPLCDRLGIASAWDAFHVQFLERIANPGRTNVEPFWFYVPALLVGLLPATFCLPCTWLTGPSGDLAGERAHTRAWFLWGWALLPVLLFSVSSGKETRYLLPTVPAWTLLAAWGWTRARSLSRFCRWRNALVRALVLGTWIAPFAWIVVGWLEFPDARSVVVATAVLMICCRAVLEWSARLGRPAIAFCALALALLAAKVAWAGTSVAEERRTAPVAEIGEQVARRLEPGEPWILVGPYRSWLDFAVNHPCICVADWDSIAIARAPEKGPHARYVLAREKALGEEAAALDWLDRWVVEGETYRLVRLH